MATIRWKRADSYEEANNYIGANGEVVVDLAENRLWVYDGANAYVTAAFTQQDGRYIAPYVWQGDTAGYIIAGYKQATPTSSTTSTTDVVQKVSFTSDGSSTDVSEINPHPALHGAYIVNHDTTAVFATMGQIIRTPYASETPVQVDVTSGSPSQAYSDGAEPWSTENYGYYNARGTLHYFPFAVNSPSHTPQDWSATGPLSPSISLSYNSSAHQSDTHGYKVMGIGTPTSTLRGSVLKFPFANVPATMTDVGELNSDSDARRQAAGGSVGGKGLIMGGRNSSDQSKTTCDAITFASDTFSTAERSLESDRFAGCGLSSTSAFYHAGGNHDGPFLSGGRSTLLSKSSAASSATFSSIGSLVSPHLQSSVQGGFD